MTTKRQKKAVLTEVSDSQANSAFATYAQAQSQIKKIQAEIELQCARIRERHADRLQQLQQGASEAFDTLQAYAQLHPELFTKRKSLDLAHGTIGFRTGTPKLKTLRGFTWAAVLTLVRQFLPDYIRTVDEVAKDRILADRNLDNVALYDTTVGDPREVSMSEALDKVGIQVVQEEAFFVECKEEDVTLS